MWKKNNEWKSADPRILAAVESIKAAQAGELLHFVIPDDYTYMRYKNHLWRAIRRGRCVFARGEKNEMIVKINKTRYLNP